MGMIVWLTGVGELGGVFIIIHEEVQIDDAGNAHQPGLEADQDNTVDAEPPVKTVILPAHTEKQPVPDEVEDGQCDAEGVADISGAEPEPGFEFKFLIAYRASFVHIEDFRKTPVKRVLLLEHVAPPAVGAFHFQHADKIIRSLAHVA